MYVFSFHLWLKLDTPHININSHSETNHSELAPLTLFCSLAEMMTSKNVKDVRTTQIYSNELNPICFNLFSAIL